MPPNSPVSPAISARIIHAALVLGVLTFWLVGWYIGQSAAVPAEALPDRRVLYVAMVRGETLSRRDPHAARGRDADSPRFSTGPRRDRQ